MALDPVPTYPGNYDANEANNSPSGSETRREGDDQIRRMKASEKATWTNVTGAVTASHTELNTLTGISTTDPIITLPSGTTKMLFYQDTAPSGWTIDSVPDNTVVRITQGLAGGGVTGGTTTGTNVFSDQFAAHGENATYGVRNHTLVEAEIPQHNHGGGNHGHSSDTFNQFGSQGSCTDTTTNNPGFTTSLINASGTIISNYGGATPAHAHTINLDAKAAPCIIATKD